MLEMSKRLILGLATYVPGLHEALRRGTGGTCSARYCYSVWLRHLVCAANVGIDVKAHTVAELGPGDSLGIGLSALLCGAERYLALDVVSHASPGLNVQVFDELVELLRARSAIPGPAEFPDLYPVLDSYEFPGHILPEGLLAKTLATERIASIRRDLLHLKGRVEYVVPWYEAPTSMLGQVDVIVSQAVLEHVDDLAAAYASMYSLLAPHGYMSHQIDFKAHGTAKRWNGHLGYSILTWRLMRGRLPYLLNRRVYSEQIRAMTSAGFDLVEARPVHQSHGIARDELAHEFTNVTEEDLSISGALILARRLR
jgi:SAM-dependent methyltransferase